MSEMLVAERAYGGSPMRARSWFGPSTGQKTRL